MSLTHLVRRGAIAFAIGPLLVALSSCGGDDDTPAAEPTTTPSAESPTADAAPGAGEAPTAAGGATDGPRFGVSLEQIAEVIAERFTEVTDVDVDGSSITITLSEGDSASDGALACLSFAGLMEEGETLTFVHPDGATTC